MSHPWKDAIYRPGDTTPRSRHQRRKSRMTDPRTKAEAILQIQYNVRLHELHRRFFSRTKTTLAFISLAGGGGAIPAALTSMPGAVMSCGLIVAIAAFADVLGRYTERAAEHAGWKRDYAELQAQTDPMTLAQIDAALAHLEARTHVEVNSLRAVAWNDTLESRGFDDVMRTETVSQKIARVMS